VARDIKRRARRERKGKRKRDEGHNLVLSSLFGVASS
jgi:hypothetical protein